MKDNFTVESSTLKYYAGFCTITVQNSFERGVNRVE